MRNKLRLELQWLGTAYGGWQSQGAATKETDPPALSDVVHAALKATTGQEGGPVVAGRTDKGVHAMRQMLTVTVRGTTGVVRDTTGVSGLQRPSSILSIFFFLCCLPSAVQVQVLGANAEVPYDPPVSGING